MWRFWARPNQIPPPNDWVVWLILAGRGFGKTRTGAEWIRERVGDGARRIALIAPTAPDARDVMVEGESGILACCRFDDARPHYEPSKRRLTWPNGAIATTFSSEEPERLRGPQHDTAWCDELAAWRYPKDTWDMMRLGLRLGDDPRSCVTTTPKPIQLIRDLLKDQGVSISRGSTFDNRANLAGVFFEEIKRLYEGTRLGRQELYAEILDDAIGALWNRAQLDAGRVSHAPPLKRVVVAIDPAATSKQSSDETGIIVVGLGNDNHGYVLADLSGRFSPERWASRAIGALDEYGADLIVAETNNGGEMVEATLRAVRRNVPYRSVHASKGKRTRAEPIAALFEQSRCHMVGLLPQLEEQLCTWDASDGSTSPDRLDAMVWGLSDSMHPYEPRAYGRMAKARMRLPRRRM